MPPLVTARELPELLALLDSPDQAFEEISARFSKAWPIEGTNRLRALLAVLLFLQEGAIRPPAQRLVALYLLRSFSRSQPLGRNLFAPFLVQAVQDPARAPAERNFIQRLLVGGDRQLGTAAEAVEACAQPHQPPLLAADDLWRALRNSGTPEAGEGKRQASSYQGADSNAAAETSSSSLAGGEGVPPPFIRPRPPPLPVQPGELRWLHAQLPRSVHWDFTAGQDPGSVAELQSLLGQALKGPLLPAQQQQVLRDLEADRKLVLSLELTPDRVPDLVEHNPVIAIEVFRRLIHFGRGRHLLPALAGLEVTLHSMEVVNRLSTAAPLPRDFMQAYIAHCIESCRTAQDDKYVQTRRVRLVCVFLHSLIKNGTINVQELFYEVQSFCIEFSRVREAAGLFRLLKTLENGEKTGEEAPQSAVASSSSA